MVAETTQPGEGPTPLHPSEERALATVAPAELLPPLPAWRQMLEMADELAKSNLVGTARSRAATVAIMLKGRELGIPAMAAVEGISIIQGKPACSATLMLGLIKRAYGHGTIRVADTSDTAATVEYQEPGWPGVRTLTFTIEQAKRAKLLGKQDSNWEKYPDAMLRARAISAVAKMAFPEVIGGLYTPEELGADVDVTPEGAVVLAHAQHEAPGVVEIVDPETGEILTTTTARSADPPPSTWSQFWPWAKSIGLATPKAIEQLLARPTAGLTPQALHALHALIFAALADPAGDDGPQATDDSGPQPGGMTEPQNRKLHAAARDKGLAHDAVRAFAHSFFGVDSLWELSTAQASTLIDDFEAGDPDELRQIAAQLLQEQAIANGQTELPSPEATPAEAPATGDRVAELVDRHVRP